MNWKKHDYDDIPGTYVFDGQKAHSSYGINKMLFSFNHDYNREAFANNAEEYAAQFGLTEAQKKALFAGDFLELLRLGANIYLVAKLIIPKGISVQDAGAAFQGITTEEFKANLTQKGVDLEKRLQEEGGYWNG